MKRKYDGHFNRAQSLSRQAVSERNETKWALAMLSLKLSCELSKMMRLK